MRRLFLALVFLTNLAVCSAWSGDENSLRLQSFVYHPMALKEGGPGFGPEAHLGPVIDRRRAYLLDIPEDEFSRKQQTPVRTVWDRIRDGFSIPPLRGALVAERERWYGQRKDIVVNISQKARRYLFHIVEAVERRGLPTELALLPIVESGFEPGALSAAQAAGLWQFIPGTAQRYRLKVTDHYDARRDIVASTEAALDYLEFLYRIFNDWQLALAAYNWGEEAVLRAVQRNQSKGLPGDYESLVLPEETRYYVPKLMAIRNIVLNPELHGVELADIPNLPYFAEVDVGQPLDIKSVAKLAELPAAEILALNPSHNSSVISGKGKPSVLLPADSVETFHRNIMIHGAKGREASKTQERRAARKAVVGLKSPEAQQL